MGRLSIAPALLVAAALLLPAGGARAQDQLGHKLLGTLGLDAGVQPEPGVYVSERALFYTADTLVDQNGKPLPLSGLDIDAFGNAVGLSVTLRIPHFAYWSGAVAAPYAHITLASDDPRTSVDRFGLGDVYVLPLKLGWRLDRFDIVTSYAFYAPTGRFEPKGTTGVGRGYWTHELAAGGTAWLDRAKAWRLSALASYDLNEKKQGIDITRGSTLQIQGGLGWRLFRVLDIGATAYALWQVTEDKGADLPDKLRGLQERAFGAGPEVDLALPPIRTRIGVRYAWDIRSRARPEGRILVLSLTFVPWRARSPPPPL